MTVADRPAIIVWDVSAGALSEERESVRVAVAAFLRDHADGRWTVADSAMVERIETAVREHRHPTSGQQCGGVTIDATAALDWAFPGSGIAFTSVSCQAAVRCRLEVEVRGPADDALRRDTLGRWAVDVPYDPASWGAAVAKLSPQGSSAGAIGGLVGAVSPTPSGSRVQVRSFEPLGIWPKEPTQSAVEAVNSALDGCWRFHEGGRGPKYLWEIGHDGHIARCEDLSGSNFTDPTCVCGALSSLDLGPADTQRRLVVDLASSFPDHAVVDHHEVTAKLDKLQSTDPFNRWGIAWDRTALEECLGPQMEPGMSATVPLVFHVDSNGNVASVASSQAVKREIMSCIEREFGRASFPCPLAGETTSVDAQLSLYEGKDIR
jgi:hypothetical protein